MPGGGSLSIPLNRHGRHGARGEAVVVKDAGDDPDVTNGAEIGARVWRLEAPGAGEDITLLGGEGVGRVTKPGLPVAVGEPAINPVPRRMIRRALRQVWDEICPGEPLRLRVEIFVPRGEELARHTLNPRLGIVGGISILGTTGLVKPFSHQAYRATIASSLRVAQAAGLEAHRVQHRGQERGAPQGAAPSTARGGLCPDGGLRALCPEGGGAHGIFGDHGRGLFRQGPEDRPGLWAHPCLPGAGRFERVGPLDPGFDGGCGPGPGGGRGQHRPAGPGTSYRSRGRRVVAQVGAKMLAALRDYAGPGPKLGAVVLDFDGSPLWQGESPGEAAP